MLCPPEGVPVLAASGWLSAARSRVEALPGVVSPWIQPRQHESERERNPPDRFPWGQGHFRQPGRITSAGPQTQLIGINGGNHPTA